LGLLAVSLSVASLFISVSAYLQANQSMFLFTSFYPYQSQPVYQQTSSSQAPADEWWTAMRYDGKWNAKGGIMSSGWMYPVVFPETSQVSSVCSAGCVSSLAWASSENNMSEYYSPNAI